MSKIDVSFDSETWGTEPGCDIRSIGACVMDVRSGLVSIPCQTCKGGTTRGNVNDGGDCSDCMNTRMEQGYGSAFYQALDNPGVPADEAIIMCSDGKQAHDVRYPHHDDVDSFRTYPLTRDPNTVQWWSEQSAEAQAAFTNPMELRQGLILFGGWLRGLSGDTYDPADHDRRFPDDRNLWSHGAAFDPPVIAAAYRACGLPVPWHYRAPRDTRTCFDMAGIDDHSAWLAATPGPLAVPHHALDDAICQARAVCRAVAFTSGAIDLTQRFGDGVANLFDQAGKGNWKDDHDHDVFNNIFMHDLRDTLALAIKWREPMQ